MVINFDPSVINLRDRLQQLGKKRGQPTEEVGEKSEMKKVDESDLQSKKDVADIINIRNENRQAAISAVRSEKDAKNIMIDLRKSFMENLDEAMNAHKSADPNAVMKFYPFE